VDAPAATAKSYGVNSVDRGKTMRVFVTAENGAGKTTVSTDRSGIVQASPATTVVVTTTAMGNKAPSLEFLSLKVRGKRVAVRFRVCDDSFDRIAVIARAHMPARLAYTRRYGVTPEPCGTYSRSWTMIPRFRSGHGRYVVTLRAVDKSKRLSLLASRGVRR
jgi:hypothetical protein